MMRKMALASYPGFVAQLKAKIRRAQLRASLAVNRELVLLYWQIGKDILFQQRQHGWGAKVVDQLAVDLHHAFPTMKGFSPRNLKYMRALAEAYPDKRFVQEVLAQITWYHNITLLEKVQDPVERTWYIHEVIQYGWSRNILVHQIESHLYNRQRKVVKTTNFAKALPPPQSDVAEQMLKDPYYFDFLTLGERARERELERGLLDHLREFLLELGVGFAFVGSQFPLQVGDETYYIDLLFYHLKLRRYIVIEVKMGDFKPEHAGKMNFYLTALDRQLKHEEDRLSLGIVLCKSKNKVLIEYALQDIQKPIGVSTFQWTSHLPKQLQSSLPTVKQLESELDK